MYSTYNNTILLLLIDNFNLFILTNTKLYSIINLIYCIIPLTITDASINRLLGYKKKYLLNIKSSKDTFLLTIFNIVFSRQYVRYAIIMKLIIMITLKSLVIK